MFRWLLVVALLLPCGSVFAQTHRVLLIHSYHSGMPWTDGQHAGFVEAIRNGGIPADVYVEYLDSLRFRHDKAAVRENLRRTLYSKFKGNPPEVIAVTDNDAMDFALEERPRFAPDAAVVFCGINGLSPDIRTRYKNLTGVAEEASFQETLELMEQWYPGRRLLVLGEESSTFRGNFQSLRAGNERTTAPFPLEVFQDPVLSHIEAKLRAAGPDTLVFILLRPVNDAGETVDSAVAVRAISAASRQPVFSVWDYMFGYGIVGGKLTSGEAHGQAAAAKVLRILRGDAADSVPIDWESPNRYLFDYQQLARFGLQGKELPPGATVINRPVNFYELHRDKVIAVAAVFTFLLLVGARLLVLNRSIKESRNLLDSIVDNIPVTIFLKRASDLSFVMFNRAGEALLGRRRDEMFGRHDYDFFPKEQAESFIGKDREVLKRDDVMDIAEEPVDTARGTRLLHTRKLALRNAKGQPVYLLGVSEDITDRKAAEEALRRHKEELEEVVQRRTAELRLALDAAQGANRAKSAFLATMSHELRTPLNAILGFSNLVSRDRQLPEHLREKVEIVNRSGEHLLALINDVLEIAKIEAGRLQLGVSAFDLRMMVTEAAAMMRLRAQEKGLRLTLDLSPDVPRFIKGDEARLRQIVINLLGNAVKFTEGGEITVRADVRRNAGLHLSLEVKDTGVGISEADLSKLFKPFVQLAEGGEQKGSGLGLTITKEFVQLMGGTIAVESVLGKGSTFRVDLPVEVAERAEVVKAGVLPRGEIAGLAPGQPVYRTLIVEDNGDNRRLLEALLNNLGMQVKVAENGEQAVSVFQEWQPALVLMDRRMPVMDGEEATRRIRRLPGGKKVRIVGVSASAFEEERHELLASGMDDFVRKPYRIEEIYDCLARQLGLRFVEAVPAEEGGPVALTPGMFSSVPESVQQALKGAVETLNAEEIRAAIRQVEQHDAALARALFRIAEEFDYQAILDALPAATTTAGV